MTSAEWNEKLVLVTGAGGFIGSTLVEQLAKDGARVRAFVRYNSRADAGLLHLLPEDLLSKIEIVFGDLRDPQAASAAVRGAEVVFHLGALIAIPYSYLHPTEVVETNILGTLNILNACREAHVTRLVHTSTSEVYGTARTVPISEEHPLQGQSPYSASKIGADKLAESFFCSFNLPVVTVRPFNTYGPRQSARAVIPTIISQALSQDVIRLGNLDTRRDFTYVSDTVAGFLQAGCTPGIEGQVFNLGTGQDVTIAETAQLILRITGSAARLELDPQRLRPERSEVLQLVSDNTLARTQLAWQPQVPFEEGLRRTIEWVRANLQRYKPGEYTV